MATEQRIGVKAVIDTSDLAKGVNDYKAALAKVISETTAAQSKLNFTPNLAGYSKLVNALQDVRDTVNATQSTLSQLGRVASPFGQASKSVNAYAKSIQQLNRTLTQTIGTQRNVTVSARETGVALRAGFGAAIGTALINGLRDISQGFVAVTTSIAENIAFWERLEVAIAFFETRTLSADQQSLSYSERIALVGEQARATTLWIQKLAILSPFTSKEVGNVFRVAQAYGLSADAAKELLPLLLDLGSAAGFDADTLERVALALGQVQARGKLTGEEIRQLGNAGIPIREILVKNLGIANNEFEKFVEEGYLTADKVIPLIIKSLKEFDGAAEAISTGTLTGLANAIQETFQVGQADFFGGFGDAIKQQFKDVIDFISNPQVRPALVVIGENLGKAFSDSLTQVRNALAGFAKTITSISPETIQFFAVFAVAATTVVGLAVSISLLSAAVAFLINPVTLLATGFGLLIGVITSKDPLKTLRTFFSTITNGVKTAARSIANFTRDVGIGLSQISQSLARTSEDVAEFGTGFVEVFAGAIRAVTGTIGTVLQAIGGIFSYWLEPQSPPRILPDLDKWGEETANIWLQGWTQADFSIFKNISDTMSSLLKSALAPGDLGGELNVVEMVIGTRPAIQQALDQIRTIGSVTQDVFNKIRATAGSASDEVIAYLQGFQRVAMATKAVQDAQAALNAVTEKYTKLLKPLQDRLKAINSTQEQASETKEIARLQGIMASKYVTDARKKQAALELETLLLQQQIRQTEEKKDAETDNAETALDAAEDAQEAAEGELELIETRIELQIEENELVRDRAEAIEAIRRAAEAAAKEADKALTPLEKQLKIIQLQQEELRGMIDHYRAVRVLLDGNATEAERAAAALTISRIEGESTLRGLEIAELGGTLDDVRAIQIVLADIEKPKAGKENPLDSLATDIDGATESAEEFAKAIEEWDTNIAAFRLKFDETIANIKQQFTDVNNAMPDFLKLVVTGEGGETTSPFLDTAKWVIGLWAVTKLLGGIFGWIGKIWSALGVVLGLFRGLGPIMAVVGAGISAVFAPIGGFITSISIAIWGFFAGLTAVTGGLLLLTVGIGAFFTAIFLNIGGLGDKTIKFVNETSAAMGEWLTNTAQRIEDWAKETGGVFLEFAKVNAKRFGDWAKESWGIIKGWAANIWQTITDWGKEAIVRADTALRELAASFTLPGILAEFRARAWQIGAKLLSGVTAPVETGIERATAAFKTLRDGIFSTAFLEEWAVKAKSIGDTIMNAIAGGISAATTSVQDAITGILDLFPQWFVELLTGKIAIPGVPTNTEPTAQAQSAMGYGTLLKETAIVGSESESQWRVDILSVLNSINERILLNSPVAPTRTMLSPAGVQTNSTVNYNLTTNTNAPSTSVVRDFYIMQALAGG